MTEHIINIGTAEVPFDLDESELVIGAMLVIHTAHIDDPSQTAVGITVAKGQDFVQTLGLARYAAKRTDRRAAVGDEEDN